MHRNQSLKLKLKFHRQKIVPGRQHETERTGCWQQSDQMFGHWNLNWWASGHPQRFHILSPVGLQLAQHSFRLPVHVVLPCRLANQKPVKKNYVSNNVFLNKRIFLCSYMDLGINTSKSPKITIKMKMQPHLASIDLKEAGWDL